MVLVSGALHAPEATSAPPPPIFVEGEGSTLRGGVAFSLHLLDGEIGRVASTRSNVLVTVTGPPRDSIVGGVARDSGRA